MCACVCARNLSVWWRAHLCHGPMRISPRHPLRRFESGSKLRDLQTQLESARAQHRNAKGRQGLAQANQDLGGKVSELEKTVREMQRELHQSKTMYIKKDGLITMEVRQAMSDLVCNGTSFNKAYIDVVTAGKMFAAQTGFKMEGEIEGDGARLQAAISSSAMTGRLVQCKRAWEMAAVVSGDGRETRGSGLTWHADERPQEAPEGVEAGMLFESQSQTPPCSQGAADGRLVSQADVVGALEAADEAASPSAGEGGGASGGAPAAEARKGKFMALAFDGTSTWWGRNFLAMAITFSLGGLRLAKMAALLEKVDKTVAAGAEGYVEAILGWVEDVRALQQRLGEEDANLLSIYDFAVFMVGSLSCPVYARARLL